MSRELYTGPYMPWFSADWQGSRHVRRMSAAARGVYREMLDLAWEEGGVLDDPEEVAHLAGLRSREVREVWDEVRAMFEIQGDRLTSPKLEKLRSLAKNRHLNRHSPGGGAETGAGSGAGSGAQNGAPQTQDQSHTQNQNQGQQRACAHTREAPTEPSQPSAGRPTDPGPPEEESPPEALRRPGVRVAAVSRADADIRTSRPPEPARGLPGAPTAMTVSEALPDLETHRPADVSAETWSSWLQAVEAQTFGLRQIHRVETRALHEGMARALVQVHEGRGLGEDWTKLPTPAERMAAQIAAKSRNRVADSPVPSVVEWLTDLDDRATRSKRGSRSYVRKALQGGPDPAEAVAPATTPPSPEPDPTHDPYPQARA